MLTLGGQFLEALDITRKLTVQRIEFVGDQRPRGGGIECREVLVATVRQGQQPEQHLLEAAVAHGLRRRPGGWRRPLGHPQISALQHRTACRL